MEPFPPGSVDLAARASIRLALVADTHGSIDRRVAELARSCTMVVHAGDVGAGAVLASLKPPAGRVLAVRGNNDVPKKWPRGEGPLLRSLPREVRVPLPGGELVVVHGDRHPARHRHHHLRRRFPRARAVVYGHSHRLVVDDAILPWVLNPGAGGHARSYGGPSCLVLETRLSRWEVHVCRFPLPAQPLGTDPGATRHRRPGQRP